MKKLLALLLAVIMIFSFAACGEGEGDNQQPEVKGEQQSWGQISVFVPEGYVLNGGSITGVDDDDPTQCAIQPETTSMYDYFWIIAKDEATVLTDIETTKSMNDAKDITVDAGGNTWTGCHYVYEAYSGNIDCGAVYCTVDGVTYLVNFCGHAPDSPELITVLSSIKAA